MPNDDMTLLTMMYAGEHTDYNMGYVFPMALPLVTVVVGAPSQDPGAGLCRVYSQSQVTEGECLDITFPCLNGDPHNIVSVLRTPR